MYRSFIGRQQILDSRSYLVIPTIDATWKVFLVHNCITYFFNVNYKNLNLLIIIIIIIILKLRRTNKFKSITIETNFHAQRERDVLAFNQR